MIRLLWAVVEDLGSFAFESVRGLFVVPTHSTETMPLLTAPSSYVSLPLHATEEAAHTLSVRPSTSLAERPQTGLQAVGAVASFILRPALQKNTVMYTASYATPLRSTPESHTSRDSIYQMLPYGSMVMVLEVSGDWARVSSGAHTGWVYAEDLAEKSADVYPAFRVGEPNEAEDPTTIRVRAIINDEFGAGDLDLPLQAEEYVLYRLYKRGAKIAWPAIRPRTPGTWHKILENTKKISLSARPSAGAIMECMLESEVDEDGLAGHIAYVEAVYPDDTIQISEANWPDKGIYNERVLPLEEWQALTPTFLVVG